MKAFTPIFLLWFVTQCHSQSRQHEKKRKKLQRALNNLLNSNDRARAARAWHAKWQARTKGNKGSRPQTRIVGGNQAGQREFPSMVLGKFGCGGNLIWHDVVLSAAHCINAFENFFSGEKGTVQAGAWKENNNGANGAQDLEIRSDMIQHPRYAENAKAWDLMLFKVERPTADWIKPSQFNRDPAVPAAAGSEPLQVIGFGRTSLTEGSSDTLLKLELPHVPIETCVDRHKGLVENASMLCTGILGTAGQGTCFRDSGGPIFDASGTQVGVVSWGEPCATGNSPDVYARITGALDWILPTICELTDFKDEFGCAGIAPFEAGPCTDNDATTPADITCTAPSYTDYRGCVNETVTGYPCQRWDVQYPHTHEFAPATFPSDDLVGNYCRNPGGDAGGPWCFTANSVKRWEYCYIPECDNGVPSCLETGQECASNSKCCGTNEVCTRDSFDSFERKTCETCAKEFFTCEKTSDCCGKSRCGAFFGFGDEAGICLPCSKKGKPCSRHSDCCNPNARCVAKPKAMMVMLPPTSKDNRQQKQCSL